jgi:hypothetical protein
LPLNGTILPKCEAKINKLLELGKEKIELKPQSHQIAKEHKKILVIILRLRVFVAEIYILNLLNFTQLKPTLASSPL